MYNLQRKVHSLKDQMQRKDLQIELLKRKLALTEEGARGKCIAQVIASSIEKVIFVSYYQSDLHFNLIFSLHVYFDFE